MQKLLNLKSKLSFMELTSEVRKLIKDGKPLEALELIKKNAPDDVRKVVERVFEKPEDIKNLSGIWKTLVLLSYFSYSSMYFAGRNDNQSLVSCVISSINAVKLSNELGFEDLIPMFLRNAARALTMMDMKDRAERMYLEAEKICEKIADFKEYAYVENDLATLYFELKRYVEARIKIETAIEIWRELEDYENLAESLTNAAEIYIKLGEFDNAEKCFKEAESIYRKLINEKESLKLNFAVMLSNFGIFYKNRNRHKEAERLLLESLKIFEELERIDDEFSQFVATTLKYLGDLNREMKRFDKANEYYRKSREKFKEIQMKWESIAG